MIERLGGRKFVLTILVLGLATAVELLTTRGITQWFAGLLIGLVGVYGASNVAITRKALMASEGAVEAEPAEDNGVVLSRLETLEQKSEMVANAVSTTNQLIMQAMNGPKK
jgi:hypothetical protein